MTFFKKIFMYCSMVVNEPLLAAHLLLDILLIICCVFHLLVPHNSAYLAMAPHNDIVLFHYSFSPYAKRVRAILPFPT